MSTKHTPTAGAMRAAKALFKDPKFFASDAKTLAERKAHYWTGKAQIIDCETAHAELVTTLAQLNDAASKFLHQCNCQTNDEYNALGQAIDKSGAILARAQA